MWMRQQRQRKIACAQYAYKCTYTHIIIFREINATDVELSISVAKQKMKDIICCFLDGVCLCQREEANAMQHKTSAACLNTEPADAPGKCHAVTINNSQKMVTVEIQFTVDGLQ